MAVFGSFRLSSSSRNKETPEFLTFPIALNNPTRSSNSGSSLAALQAPKNSENNLQQIFKIVFESQLPSTYGQDQKISQDPLEWAFKPGLLSIYKGKFHMDYYNFMQ